MFSEISIEFVLLVSRNVRKDLHAVIAAKHGAAKSPLLQVLFTPAFTDQEIWQLRKLNTSSASHGTLTALTYSQSNLLVRNPQKDPNSTTRGKGRRDGTL